MKSGAKPLLDSASRETELSLAILGRNRIWARNGHQGADSRALWHESNSLRLPLRLLFTSQQPFHSVAVEDLAIGKLESSLKRAFALSPASNNLVRSFQDLDKLARQTTATMERQARSIRDLAGSTNSHAAALSRAARAESTLARASGARHRVAFAAERARLAFSYRMADQRRREEREAETAHRNTVRRLEREHALARRSMITRARDSFTRSHDGVDRFTRGPVIAATAGLAAAGLAARRTLMAEADTDAAEVNTRIFESLSKDAARELRTRWAAPLSEAMGVSTAEMLRSYTEALKVGIAPQGAHDFAALAVKTSEAWNVGLDSVNEHLGTVNQILTSDGSPFSIDRIKSVANTLNLLSARMATTPEKMLSFLQRGVGGASLLGMSQEAGLAFGAASTSLGNQAAESGRMLDYIAGRIIRVPQLVRQSGEEGKQARELIKLLGYGSAQALDRRRRADPDGFMVDLMERFRKIRDPRKREQAIRFFAGQEWLGEFSRMVTGLDTVKEAWNLKREAKGLDSIAATWELHKTKLAFTFKQFRAGWLNILGEAGAVLSPIARQVGDYFLRWTQELRNGGLRARIDAAIRGLIEGFGFKSIPDLLQGIFGVPGQGNAAAIESWYAAARGFAEGLRDLAAAVMAVVRAFAGADADSETVARWAARLLGFSLAVRIAKPAIDLLAGIGSVLLGFGAAVLAFASYIRTARLAAAIASLQAASAAGAAARGGVAGWLLRAFPWLAGGGLIGSTILDEARRRDPNGNAFGKNEDAERMREEERRRAEDRRKMFSPNSPLYQKQHFIDLNGERSLITKASFRFADAADELKDSFSKLQAHLQLASLPAMSRLTGTDSAVSSLAAPKSYAPTRASLQSVRARA